MEDQKIIDLELQIEELEGDVYDLKESLEQMTENRDNLIDILEGVVIELKDGIVFNR